MKLQLKFTTEPLVAAINDVIKLQTFLTAFGYDIGLAGIDGDFGNDTEEALGEFKLTGRLKKREITKVDFTSFIETMGLRLSLKDVPAFGFLEKSDRVKALQELLADLGYDIGESGADMTFGNDTRTALENFNAQGAILSADFHLDLLLRFFDGDAGNLPAGDEHFTERVLAIARDQWDFFRNQEILDFEKNANGTYRRDSHGNQFPIYVREGKKEFEDGWFQRVGVYWREGVNNPNLDGRDRDQAWSAAFISYVMRKAGAGNRFLYNQSHSVYIRKAIRSKENEDETYGFWGHRLTEYAPKVGDLICYSRESGITYDSNISNNHPYISHSDIVVAVEGRIIKVIGGNVEQSVSMKHIDVDENGLLIDKKKSWFAVLQNRISGS